MCVHVRNFTQPAARRIAGLLFPVDTAAARDDLVKLLLFPSNSHYCGADGDAPV
jgi:hypothetical protein